MRLLFVLRGLPGSGKSTFIEKNEFKPYTVEPDSIRMLIGGLSLNTQGILTIPQENDSCVWKYVNEILENRLQKGILTFLDATSISLKTLRKYKGMCEKYNTRMVIVDFTNVSVEECIKRNKNRPLYKFVPDDIIYRMNDELKKVPENELKKFEIISPENIQQYFEKYCKQLCVNTIEYNKVIVFGDVHGCYSVLDTVMKKYDYSDDNLYVFSGDMLDRGIQNKEVLQFCLDNCEKKNFIFVEGNHDSHLKKWVKDKSYMVNGFDKTLSELTDEQKHKLSKFTRKLRQCVIIVDNKNNQSYLVTHGGISSSVLLRLSYVPTHQLIHGVGKYPDSKAVDMKFSQMSKLYEKIANIVSIHGHRNIDNELVHNTSNTYNLEEKVEFGGYLRYVEINDGIITPFEEKNDVYDKTLVQIRQKTIVDQLNDSPLIYIKNLGDGTSSYNFTREAFYDSKWNKLTTTARGLFIDNETKEIVARSYNKFGNVIDD